MSQLNVSFSNGLDIESPKLAPIISYPHFSTHKYAERISEMKSLGVTSISLSGKTIVNGSPVAGKGCVGLVVKARIGNEICALKIRRTDADRESMANEAYYHKSANAIGVGPKLIKHTKNIMAMEFVNGKSIIEWAKGTTKDEVQTITRSLLEQCRSLDKAGLDHGELSRLHKHVIVSSNTPVIIDFESASTLRKTCNVTAAAQSVFLYGRIASEIKKTFGPYNNEKIVNALRTYKQDKNDANFSAILNSLSI